jgi:hypothetical protein
MDGERVGTTAAPGTGVFVFVGVLVATPAGVLVGVIVGVLVGVLVGGIPVTVGVLVGVFVGVLVGVGVGVVWTTVRAAVLLVDPVPPSFDVTAPVVLLFTPLVVPVTLTANMQFPLAASVPPESDTLLEPIVAVITPAPHVPVRPFGEAITRPAGKLSVKLTPARALPVFGFVIVKVREVVPLREMLAAPKALLMVGGATTVSEAIDVFPVP